MASILDIIDEDGPEGAVVTIADPALIQEPELHAMMARAGAAYRGKGRWTVGKTRVLDLGVRIDGWAAPYRDGTRRPDGLADGQRGPYRIRCADGQWFVTAPKPFIPALKRIGAAWHEPEAAYCVGYANIDLLRDLIAEAEASEQRARDLPWPTTIPGLVVTVRADGCVAVQTPYSESIVDALKGVPTACWDRGARVWVVKPKYRIALRKALMTVAGEIETVHGVQSEIDAVALPTSAEVAVTERDGRVIIRSPYDEALIAACRKAGLRWDGSGRAWRGPAPTGRARSALANALDEAIARAAARAEKPAPNIDVSRGVRSTT